MSVFTGLKAIGVANPAPHVEGLTNAMFEFGITDKRDQAAFLANCAHETGLFKWLRELWGPTSLQAKYETRKDLGNCQTGDGKKFKGRGYIQLTGRANYTAAAADLGLPLLDHPEQAEQPEIAARLAGWFWKKNGISKYVGDFDGQCDKVNKGRKTVAVGDALGFAERKKYYDILLKEL